MKAEYDAVVVGSGPNGLAAAVELARAGLSVAVLEQGDTIGGGTRTAELTLPGFAHDVCSGAHPMGILSPFFRQLPLERHGLQWIQPPASVAHPLDGAPAVVLWRSLERTCAGLASDGRRYRALIEPLVADAHSLLADVMRPLGRPAEPLLLARFGALALWPSTWLSRAVFRAAAARALFAGCAAHSVLSLSHFTTSALGLLFLVTGHVEEWPVAAGGSSAITAALASYLGELGGVVRTRTAVRSLADLPAARVAIFDTDPVQMATICAPALPSAYLARLRRFHFGPGVFKLDWALDAPIPWTDRRCLQASTVHVGGTMEEIAASERAMWRGEHAEKPFLIVVQQSQFDSTRAPAGKHTGYAYCHVPHDSRVDMSTAIEAQMERFAPGFGKLVLARHAMNTADFARYNPNCVGGAITGGAATIGQLFTRPVARRDPYSTPNPRIYLCSASTPPGGGVHGMCGYNAARSALRRIDGLAVANLEAQ